MKRKNVPSLNELRKIGWACWDPLDLKHFLDHELVNPPVGEYDTYLLKAAGMLINGDSRENAANYLQNIITEQMGLESDEVDLNATRETVDGIGEYIQLL
ncbi:hypothetical protein [Parasphingorhabdus sp.]|uniref:hypothetical protein n=1 Tax=Parasphingorhabdus sp. TaxID=2709688 RepID=UPI0032678C5E